MGSTYRAQIYDPRTSSLDWTGGNGREQFVGTVLGDTLRSNGGDDLLLGDNGADILEGGSGADVLNGGEGSDTAYYLESPGPTGVNVNLTSGTGQGGDASGDTYVSIENVVGSGGIDTLTGNSKANALSGNGGNDNLDGMDGADILDGGAGDDKLIGGSGADALTGGTDTAYYLAAPENAQDGAVNGVDVNLGLQAGHGGDAEGDTYRGVENVIGSNFNDVINGDVEANDLVGANGNDTLCGAAGADKLAGGDGTDTAYYLGASAAVDVNLGMNEGQGSDAQDDTYDSIENVIGSGFNDIINGNNDANELYGADGNDTLCGALGADKLVGGSGDDGGLDTIYYGNAPATDTSDRGVLVDLVNGVGQWGEAEGDQYADIENVVGSGHKDTLIGSATANKLEGRDGNDTLQGGAGGDTLTGGTGGDILQGGAGADTLDGGAHYDILSFENAQASDANGRGVSVDLAAGTGQWGDAQGDTYADIEAVEGSNFHDVLQASATGSNLNGRDGNDQLIGKGGIDTLFGGTGTDLLKGGEGIDYLIGEDGSDRLEGGGGEDNLSGGNDGDVLQGDDGIDILLGETGSDTLDGGAGGDTLTGGDDDGGSIDIAWYWGSTDGVTVDLEGPTGPSASGGHAQGDILQGIEGVMGSSYNDTLVGSAGNNILDGALDGKDDLNGEGGNDTLIGGAGQDLLNGGADQDSLVGGAGDDTYHVDSAGDVVVEFAGEGTDTIYLDSNFIGTSFTLGADSEVEIVQADSEIAGINLTGSNTANTLIGNESANVLDGRGGEDTLRGGAGDDVYYIDNAGDRVEEGADEGADRAVVSLSFSLSNLAHVEVLQLADGTAAEWATGDGRNNRLIGNGAFNILDGGAGADTMEGGAGSDVFVIDNAGDVVVEAAGGGTDAVQTSISYTLAGGREIEVLTALGTGALALTGNELANTLNGNVGANTLAGQAGNDILNGLDGTDVLKGGEGTDTLKGGTGTDTLAGDAGSDVLWGEVGNDMLSGGADNDTLWGGSENDLLTGDDGNDVLWGGLGKDTLTGGVGADRFVFDTRFSKANTDTIKDFKVRQDKIVLEADLFKAHKSLFNKIKKATPDKTVKLDKAFFTVGTKAGDGNDFFFYNRKSGMLSYDKNGAAAGGVSEIAKLNKKLSLTNADILFI